MAPGYRYIRPIRGAAGRFWLRKKKKILSRIQIISTPYGVQQQDESDELSSEKDSSTRVADDTHVIPDLGKLPLDPLAWFLWKKFHFNAKTALLIADEVRQFQKEDIETCTTGLHMGLHRWHCHMCRAAGAPTEDGRWARIQYYMHHLPVCPGKVKDKE